MRALLFFIIFLLIVFNVASTHNRSHHHSTETGESDWSPESHEWHRHSRRFGTTTSPKPSKKPRTGSALFTIFSKKF
ncbi:hypothetical protein L596_023225 [Steinernema carpocapsae]|uniref:Uncharacterized protein n=1 Tax=Steinernema carpocapsae TaxID=34508 RepID=A0A4U5MD11_STECR|nr:hypothetical protein L596_023225 [Steinernema carpocapsae]